MSIALIVIVVWLICGMASFTIDTIDAHVNKIKYSLRDRGIAILLAVVGGVPVFIAMLMLLAYKRFK